MQNTIYFWVWNIILPRFTRWYVNRKVNIYWYYYPRDRLITRKPVEIQLLNCQKYTGSLIKIKSLWEELSHIQQISGGGRNLVTYGDSDSYDGDCLDYYDSESDYMD